MSGGASRTAGDEPVISAGGIILIRRTELGGRVAVLENGGLASLPRAEVGPGESAETAARRAARVFTGVEVRLSRTIGETREPVGHGLALTWFWVASPTPGRGEATEGAPSPPAGFHLHWMEVEEASLALDSDDEAELLRHLREDELRPTSTRLAQAERRVLQADLPALRDRLLTHREPLNQARAVNQEHAGAAMAPEASREPIDLDEVLDLAQLEVQRAEERLDRGDLQGARRAHGRAARASLMALDGPGRKVEFARLLRALPEADRQGLGLGTSPPGAWPELEDLLCLHDAAEARGERQHRAQVLARGLQLRAAISLLASVAVLSWLALSAPLATQFDLDTPGLLALHFGLIGGVGGWTSGSVRRVRGGDSPPIAAYEAALGAGAGLAAGAALCGGFTLALAGGHLAFAAGMVYAAGWCGARLLASPGPSAS